MEEEKGKLQSALALFHSGVGVLATAAGSALAGSASSLCSTLFLQPLDVIKTRQQVNNRKFMETIHSIATKEGLTGFWRGSGPTILRILPGSALYFYTLDQMTQFLKKYYRADHIPVHAAILSGAFARSFSCIVFLPITVVKTKFEALGSARTYSSTYDALVQIKKTKGVRGLYSGLLPTLLRDAPFSAVYYGIYTQSKQHLELYFMDDFPTYVLHFSAGVFSGFLATLITHPFDVIKSIIQAHNGEYYKGMLDTAVKVLKTSGNVGLMRGFVPRVTRRTLSVAFTWTFYEQLSLIIKEKNT